MVEYHVFKLNSRLSEDHANERRRPRYVEMYQLVRHVSTVGNFDDVLCDKKNTRHFKLIDLMFNVSLNTK